MKGMLARLAAVAVLVLLTGCGPDETTQPLDTIVSNPEPAQAIKPLNQLMEAATEPDADGVSLLGVGIAGESAYIEVRFRGPKDLIEKWWQGSVYVVDESTGYVFSYIPYVAVVGLLFGKPAHDNQPGYFMLHNEYGLVKYGSKLTVVLGNFKRLHVEVRP